MSAPGEIDPYVCLGISPGASLLEIRRAYKSAVQKYHPDRNSSPDAHEVFIRVQWAYRILLEAPEGAYIPPVQASDEPPSPVSTQPTPPVTGKEGVATVVVHIPLDQVGSQQEKVVSARVAQSCVACSGVGTNCQACAGSGQVLVTRRWRIVIPARTPDGTWLVGAMLGHSGARFGRQGDVMVQVRWTDNGVWRWDDGRLVAHIKLAPRVMRRGGLHPIRMPDGRWVWWTIPPQTVMGQWFQWRGINWGGVVSDAWIQVERGWSLFSRRGRRDHKKA